MTSISHLTNSELTGQLSLRSDLTDLEHELVDRLIRTDAVIADLESTCYKLRAAKQDDSLLVQT